MLTSQVQKLTKSNTELRHKNKELVKTIAAFTAPVQDQPNNDE